MFEENETKLSIPPEKRTAQPRGSAHDNHNHQPDWNGPHFQVISFQDEILTHHRKNMHFKHALESQILITFVAEGSIAYETPSQTHRLRRGTLYLINRPSQVITSLSKSESQARCCWVLLGGDLAMNSFSYLTQRFGHIHQITSYSKLENLFTQLIRDLKSSPNSHSTSVTVYKWFHELWCTIENHRNNLKLSIDQEPKPSALIGHQCATFKEYATKLGYSPSHLSRELKQRWGKSPGHALRQIRLEEAARLLRQTNLSAGEVAQQVGYCSTSSFHRAFHSRFGRTPIRYRKSLRCNSAY